MLQSWQFRAKSYFCRAAKFNSQGNLQKGSRTQRGQQYEAMHSPESLDYHEEKHIEDNEKCTESHLNCQCIMRNFFCKIYFIEDNENFTENHLNCQCVIL